MCHRAARLKPPRNYSQQINRERTNSLLEILPRACCDPILIHVSRWVQRG